MNNKTKTAPELEANEIRKEGGNWYIYSKSGKHLSGPYRSENLAQARLAQIEYFKFIRKHGQK